MLIDDDVVVLGLGVCVFKAVLNSEVLVALAAIGGARLRTSWSPR